MTPPKDAGVGTEGEERDHGTPRSGDDPLSDVAVPRPQDALSEGSPTAGEVTGADNRPGPSESARCAHCKTLTRPGFLCKTCSRFVPFPVEKVKTPGYNQLPEGF